ncbi:unnamed protein product [Ascophyllum nodosum]
MEGNSPEHGTAQRPEAGASSEHETGSAAAERTTHSHVWWGYGNARKIKNAAVWKAPRLTSSVLNSKDSGRREG